MPITTKKRAAAPPNNIKELRDDLLDAFTQLRADPSCLAQVEVLSNTAGKIINSVKIELDYADAKKVTPVIEFLDYERR